jgi:hypothetical protein
MKTYSKADHAFRRPEIISKACAPDELHFASLAVNLAIPPRAKKRGETGKSISIREQESAGAAFKLIYL